MKRQTIPLEQTPNRQGDVIINLGQAVGHDIKSSASYLTVGSMSGRGTRLRRNGQVDG